jgi:TolB protein
MKLGCTFTPSKMSGRVFSLIWIFYLAGASMAAAFDWPWKRTKQNALENTDAPRIQIASFSGGTGASATKALRSALMTARELFPISESSPGAFLVTGTSTGGRVVAHLKGSDGKEIFERTYAAPGLDENVKTLSDDLIYAVTGRPGLASSRITFVSDVSGNKQIYVCDLDGGNVEQITREPYGAAAPTVSADASLMAYMSYRSGFSVVQVLDLGGGREQAFSETSGGSTGPAFSPDGRFLSMTLGFVGTPELFVTELGTGRTVCLTETTGVPCSPTWHPKDPVDHVCL